MSAAIGNGNKLDITREVYFPHSLGCSIPPSPTTRGSRSRRVQGHGAGALWRTEYAQLILDHLIDLKPDGSFRLDISYFDYCTGLRMTNEKFDALFGGPARKPEND
jgi:carbamoyltransferase